MFFVGDWLRESGLRMCGLAARGLWIELLCHMHKMEHRGELRLNGKALGKQEIAALVGSSESTVEAALKQLLDYGVAEKDDDGTIYSRRMVREEKQRLSKVEAGRKGGKKKKKKQKRSKGEAALEYEYEYEKDVNDSTARTREDEEEDSPPPVTSSSAAMQEAHFLAGDFKRLSKSEIHQPRIQREIAKCFEMGFSLEEIRAEVEKTEVNDAPWDIAKRLKEAKRTRPDPEFDLKRTG